jgi:nitronate monooxygenase
VPSPPSTRGRKRCSTIGSKQSRLSAPR